MTRTHRATVSMHTTSEVFRRFTSQLYSCLCNYTPHFRWVENLQTPIHPPTQYVCIIADLGIIIRVSIRISITLGAQEKHGPKPNVNIPLYPHSQFIQFAPFKNRPPGSNCRLQGLLSFPSPRAITLWLISSSLCHYCLTTEPLSPTGIITEVLDGRVPNYHV